MDSRVSPEQCASGVWLEHREVTLRIWIKRAMFRKGQTKACTAVSLHIWSWRDSDREERNRHRFVTRQWTFLRGTAIAEHTGEKMDTTTLLVIVLVVLLLGGGGYFYRRRI
jgi:LPXTG-motif cell wall-anchored protein